jgi:hypothetical protein
MENTEFDDTLLPLFSELDMAIFMPSIDLTAPEEAAPEEAAPEAPPDADDLLHDTWVPDATTWPTYTAAIDWINEQCCVSDRRFGVVTKNSKKRRDGTLKTVYLRCDRGYERKARDQAKRKTFAKGEGRLLSMTQCQRI